MIRILHLSDIHLSTLAEAGKYRIQLETDLKNELRVRQLDYLIISGDIAEHSTPDEYKAAFELVDGLVRRFRLDSSRVVVVPGNHDLNWDISAQAYAYIPRHNLPDPLTEEYIPAGDAGALKRDEERYEKRFENFSTHFYKKVCATKFPPDYPRQGILHLGAEDRILFLALNSCWNIDHHFTGRASINMEALTHAFDQMSQGNHDDWLKIAVWHHPISGREMMNDEFMELLAVHGFQICMHGHIHEAIEGFYKYDAGRRIHIVGAGTFGAPAKEQLSGIPLQYNLLIYDTETQTITVETRKKEKPDGAWSADARWGDKNNPVPRYTIDLKGADALSAPLTEQPVAEPGKEKPPESQLDMDIHMQNNYGQITGVNIGNLYIGQTQTVSSQGKSVNDQAQINFKLKSELADALLACSSVNNRGSRDTIVNSLRDDIKNAIRRNNASRVDVMNIVGSCLDYSNGLKELIMIVRSFEGKSKGMQKVDEVILNYNLES